MHAIASGQSQCGETGKETDNVYRLHRKRPIWKSQPRLEKTREKGVAFRTSPVSRLSRRPEAFLMDAAVFEKFRALVHDRSGISLGPNKESLVSARIAKRMRCLGIATHEGYLEHVLGDETEMIFLIDAISTNVTSFFREPDHFNFLRTIVPQWVAKGQTRFRFWSAASSSGEEPYSLAVTLLDVLQGRNLDVRILATDISTRMLDKCREALYSEERMRNVPRAIRDRYFVPCRSEREILGYSPIEEARRLIAFRRLNLSQPPFPMQGPMDAVFCRNVMIYFDNAVRKRLLEDIYRLLKPGGYLFVGHAESLTGIMSRLVPVRSSVYMKPSK
ncbi:MAG TPA: protein-glutamate O-methyltransferase CheR [Candidatus Hydrogenedentes bacterium]|nr:protein-glutamate O-methyltransferase CheR [Candidatus Hydrogenedentota bacterium]